MKRYIQIVTAVLLVITTACQDLDREFVTSIGKKEIEQSFTNVQNLLTSIYSDIPDGTVYIGGAAMMASASDESEFTTESPAIQAFNSGSWNAISNPDQVWGTY